MLSFSNTDTCNKKWYATLIILFGYVTRRRDGNLNDPTPSLSLHSNNLDIQSTVFVSFHVNSIRCKHDLVSLLEKSKGKTMFRHGINETKLHNIWYNYPCRLHQSSFVVFNFQTFIGSFSFIFIFILAPVLTKLAFLPVWLWPWGRLIFIRLSRRTTVSINAAWHSKERPWEQVCKRIINNYSSSPNGLWVNSPWGRGLGGKGGRRE